MTSVDSPETAPHDAGQRRQVRDGVVAPGSPASVSTASVEDVPVNSTPVKSSKGSKGPDESVDEAEVDCTELGANSRPRRKRTNARTAARFNEDSDERRPVKRRRSVVKQSLKQNQPTADDVVEEASPIGEEGLDSQLPKKRRKKKKKGAAKATRTADPSKNFFCECRNPADTDKLMIGCDECDGWYHAECVGLNERQARMINSYTCVSCRQRNVMRYPEKQGNDAPGHPVPDRSDKMWRKIVENDVVAGLEDGDADVGISDDDDAAMLAKSIYQVIYDRFEEEDYHALQEALRDFPDESTHEQFYQRLLSSLRSRISEMYKRRDRLVMWHELRKGAIGFIRYTSAINKMIDADLRAIPLMDKSTEPTARQLMLPIASSLCMKCYADVPTIHYTEHLVRCSSEIDEFLFEHYYPDDASYSWHTCGYPIDFDLDSSTVPEMGIAHFCGNVASSCSHHKGWQIDTRARLDAYQLMYDRRISLLESELKQIESAQEELRKQKTVEGHTMPIIPAGVFLDGGKFPVRY